MRMGESWPANRTSRSSATTTRGPGSRAGGCSTWEESWVFCLPVEAESNREASVEEEEEEEGKEDEEEGEEEEEEEEEDEEEEEAESLL